VLPTGLVALMCSCGGRVAPDAVVFLPASNVQAVSLGSSFGCLLLSDDSVQCWGDDDLGQLGSAVTTQCPTSGGLFEQTPCSPTPVAVPGVTSAVAVASGLDFACALSGSGSVTCWGGNSMGQLGTSAPIGGFSPPVVVATGASALAVGYQSACALGAGGSWECWGADPLHLDAQGQPVPSPAGWDVDIDGAVDLVLYGNGGCARWADGSVQCFGVLLWDSQTEPPQPPTPFPGLAPLAQLSATCGVTQAAEVVCWGYNSYGQVGVSPSPPVPPTIVPGVYGAIQVAAPGEGNCALLGAGTVQCWGRGVGLYDGPSPVAQGCNGYYPGGICSSPVSIPGMQGAQQLSVASGGGCAVLAGGTVGCWGGWAL
jgi:hypothetical protein